MYFVLRPLRLLLKAMVVESTPRQMSLGLALGVMVGLVPKGNLLAVGLGIALAATRVNLPIAGAAIVAASFCAAFCDALFDRVGDVVLTLPALQSFWTQLYNTPFMPWTRFNNTIVMGSLLTGLMLIVPVHLVSRPLFERYAPVLGERARRWWLTRVLLGAEWADRIASTESR